jgi:E3 ubiquitin-protein ligase HUWE1
MHVSKESFLMSTLGAVHGVNWHKEVKVIIAGEEKVLDAGGLLREWINLTMKEIMHPESGMFELAETEDATYKMNSDADPVEHVLDCFRLLGIVVGKAIFERIPINAFFDRSIIRHILG